MPPIFFIFCTILASDEGVEEEEVDGDAAESLSRPLGLAELPPLLRERFDLCFVDEGVDDDKAEDEMDDESLCCERRDTPEERPRDDGSLDDADASALSSALPRRSFIGGSLALVELALAADVAASAAGGMA